MPSSSKTSAAAKPSRYCAVVVTYNPDLTALLKRLGQRENIVLRPANMAAGLVVTRLCQ